MERPDLKSYAARGAASKGRNSKEPCKDGDLRSAFELDRDRVFHSRSFRLLGHKTQVFVSTESDYYRSRLTHTLEVAQITRSVARRLLLNEDLAETIALSHDLGHPPFGHSGERTLNDLMGAHGGFEHNKQSLRVVEELEHRYPGFQGLNLTWEVLEGIVKHDADYDKLDLTGLERFDLNSRPTLEAQIISYADEIAYNNHDMDDGLKSGYLNLSSLFELELWSLGWKAVTERYNEKDERILIKRTISYLIGMLIDDLVRTSERRIVESGVETLDDVRKAGRNLIGLSDEVSKMNKELKRFLYANLYRHYRVERMRRKACKFLGELFETFREDTGLMPGKFVESIDRIGKERAVCDYLAGMTDRFAMDEYKRLFMPYESV